MIPDRENIGSLTILELIPMADQLYGAGYGDSALELYTEWIRRSDSPLKFVACFNLGVMLAGQHEPVRAKDAYEQALEFNPDFMQARLNLGTVLEQLGQQDDALAQWRLALLSKEVEKPESMPLRLHALNNLGRLLEKQRQFKSALDILEQSLVLDTTQRDVMLHLVHLAQKICRWPIYVPPKGMTCEDLVSGTSPLAMLAVSDDPAVQLAASQRFVAYKYPLPPEPLSASPEYCHDKIRIGYLSSNLSTHAVSLLTVELFELHDRSKFEVYGFCWSPEDRTAFRQRVINGFDHFIRIGELSDKEAAESIRSHEIDILVDLQGLTSGARPLILSYRPAPLQVTYLGFPGPTGLPWIDYVIADRYMIPEEEVGHYTEKPLYHPNCFQVSDSKREVGPMPKRSDYSLPDNAFVYCSFNNNYKYTPEIFGAWMRILRRVPKSVLWLLADNEWAKENLCKVAEKMGIKKERLIFAPRVSPAEYLARYQLADLFLDTYPFNGGTTANDALFMGLPLLTLSGRTFASRYAGSLLTNLGLTELITTSHADYERAAIFFAKNVKKLLLIKERLGVAKSVTATFNTAVFIKGYELALENIVKRSREQLSAAVSLLPVQVALSPAISGASEPDSSSEDFVRCTSGFGEEFLCRVRTYGHERIRIGYLLTDSGLPEVDLLLPGSIGGHHRTRFEVYGYTLGLEVGEQPSNSFDHVRLIHTLNDRQAAELIVQDEIDVLIDLHGHGSDSRPGIFALHPAPSQGAYFGHVGATAMPWFDFVLADRNVLPQEAGTTDTGINAKLPLDDMFLDTISSDYGATSNDVIPVDLSKISMEGRAMASRIGMSALRLRGFADAIATDSENSESAIQCSRHWPIKNFKTRILVIRQLAMGDVILTTPIVKKLFHDYQGHCVIDILTKRADVYANNPWVNEVFTPENMKKNLLDYDKVINLDLAYEKQPQLHIVDAYAYYSHGFEFPDSEKRLELFPSFFDKIYIKERMKNEVGRDYLVIHMRHDTWPSRNLPLAVWKQFVDILIEKTSLHIVQVGSGHEIAFDYNPRLLNYLDKLTLHELKCVIEGSKLYVGIDSGTLHVAATTDVPMICLFTSAHHDMRKPLGRSPYTPFIPIMPKLSCYGCQKNITPPITGVVCHVGDPYAPPCISSFDVTDFERALAQIPGVIKSM